MKQTSTDNSKLYTKFLSKVSVRHAVAVLPELHEEAFEKIDCLNCAACCKNYSPRFKTPDIKRIAKHLRMKEGVFIESYLRLDEEGDYVTKQHPCPFLGFDNKCDIYEMRPSDCSRFPYTDEDILLKRKNITIKNATFCPAVSFVLDELMKRFNSTLK